MPYDPQHHTATATGIASLRNVTLALDLAQTLLDRDAGLPGIGVFHGASGLGKSFGAARVHAFCPSLYLELARAWTPPAFLKALCEALGASVPVAAAARFETAVDALIARQDRQGQLLLILDEADYACANQMVDWIRDLHEKSRVPVMLIGEERLPAKLTRWERMHNRVLRWTGAERCNLDDARALVETYTRGITVDDAVLLGLLRATTGVTRRVVINLTLMKQLALAEGLKAIGESDLKALDFRWQTGDAPAARGTTL